MSKLLDNVLSKVSENNNEYRLELRSLNNLIDEKATALIGDVVTLSNYTVDFSNALSTAKEKLIAPILRVIESYVIKDLRSVESVNEQFVEKINDRIENSNITTKDDRDKFISNLNVLLNNKYLQIVEIKRINFLNENGTNAEVDKIIDDFINILESDKNYETGNLHSIFETFKNEIYKLITNSLSKISNIYLNNFVREVSEALENIMDDYDIAKENDSNLYSNDISDFNTDSKVNIPIESSRDYANQEASYDTHAAKNPEEFDAAPFESTFDIPQIPNIPEVPQTPEIPAVADNNPVEEVKPMDIKPIAPIEIIEETQKKEDKIKHPYDVEEILKIAKSPVVTMNDNESISNNSYVSVKPINKQIDTPSLDDDFNEREVVEEMIKRLTRRLELIDERQAKLDEEKLKLEADEKFVNDLIKNSSDKKLELDELEESLNEKEKELESKKEELDKKIKNVLPFANAVLNGEEEFQ